MKKKIVRSVDGEKSSIVYYEDGTKEVMPEGVYISYPGPDADEKEKDEDLMKKYRKLKKGDM